MEAVRVQVGGFREVVLEVYDDVIAGADNESRTGDAAVVAHRLHAPTAHYRRADGRAQGDVEAAIVTDALGRLGEAIVEHGRILCMATGARLYRGLRTRGGALSP